MLPVWRDRGHAVCALCQASHGPSLVICTPQRYPLWCACARGVVVRGARVCADHFDNANLLCVPSQLPGPKARARGGAGKRKREPSPSDGGRPARVVFSAADDVECAPEISDAFTSMADLLVAVTKERNDLKRTCDKLTRELGESRGRLLFPLEDLSASFLRSLLGISSLSDLDDLEHDMFDRVRNDGTEPYQYGGKAISRRNFIAHGLLYLRTTLSERQLAGLFHLGSAETSRRLALKFVLFHIGPLSSEHGVKGCVVFPGSREELYKQLGTSQTRTLALADCTYPKTLRASKSKNFNRLVTDFRVKSKGDMHYTKLLVVSLPNNYVCGLDGPFAAGGRANDAAILSAALFRIAGFLDFVRLGGEIHTDCAFSGAILPEEVVLRVPPSKKRARPKDEADAHRHVTSDRWAIEAVRRRKHSKHARCSRCSHDSLSAARRAAL